jgi:hypothetical protein
MPALDALASFLPARAVHPLPREPSPWTDEAILWIPGEPPLYGRRRIECRLAEDPDLLPTALSGELSLAASEDHALERGQGRWGCRKMQYFRLWRRASGGEWHVARELWEETPVLVRIL